MDPKFPIGSHVSKKPSLSKTFIGWISAPHLPIQIMFGRSSKIFISEEEVSKSLEIVNKYKLKVFVHTPYILNLCSERAKIKDDYIIKCIQAHLSYCKRFGAKGVVVHVGKSCKLKEKDALENMRKNIEACLESSSEECPLLLETPAGQGTETLTTVSELLDFVESFHSKKLGVCVDTCHVFASGILPSEALNICCSKPEWKSCVKLVHFNDSAKDQGCCVDRHAPIGTGKIPLNDLLKCAECCEHNGIPMLNE
jgi:Endonuclease IV